MATLMTTSSNITAPTQYLRVQNETYAYRRFGGGAPHPLVFLQHFRGRWTIGIRPLPTLSRPDEKSSCSTTRVSDAQPARFPRRFREWRRKHSLSWMRLDSNAWIYLGTPSGAWLRKK